MMLEDYIKTELKKSGIDTQKVLIKHSYLENFSEMVDFKIKDLFVDRQMITKIVKILKSKNFDITTFERTIIGITYINAIKKCTKLERIRKSKNLSIREVERLTGVCRQTLIDLERNKVKPRKITLVKLAIGLNVKISDLM